MKSGKYNVNLQINDLNMPEYADTNQAIYEIAKLIIAKHEAEEDLSEIVDENSFLCTEEFEEEYEIDDDDCSEHELNFDDDAA